MVDGTSADPSPTKFQLIGLVHPTWDSNGAILSFGNRTWKFRRLPGRPLMKSLDEFEKRKWPPSVELASFVPEHVRDVAKELRKKTKGCINWRPSSDSTLSWRLDS